MVVPVTDTRNDGGREPFNYSLVMRFDPNEWGLIQWAFKQPLAPELSEFLGRRI
jgi:hypothetical protein